jgi:lysophospholipid acyltransferase (LPLAT)-like uncharacterized protein
MPFARAAFVWGNPMWVSADTDIADVERTRVEVQDALNRVTAEAERLATEIDD